MSFEIFETFNSETVEPFLEPIEANSIEYLGQIESLQEANWQELTPVERLDALGNLEARLAEIQGREPCEVVAEQMRSERQCGYYDGEKIVVNSQHLEDSRYRMEVIDTIAHEGRHAYQHWAVEHPGFHPNEAEVRYWTANMIPPSNYLSPRRFGPEIYESQPIEVDARWYASQVTRYFA